MKMTYKITLVVTRHDEDIAISLAQKIASAVRAVIEPAAEVQVSEWADDTLVRVIEIPQ